MEESEPVLVNVKEPRIDSEESISAALCSLLGRYDKCRVVVPPRQAGNLLLGSLKGLQILALEINVQSSLHRIVYGTG